MVRMQSTSEAQAAKAANSGDPGHVQEKPPDSASLKDRIAHFTWPWFACTMSTGAVAVLLAQTPNKFDGINIIGKIFFIFDLVLFAIFNAAMTCRAVLFPRRFSNSLHHPVEGLFFGAYWVSVSLILTCIQAYGVPNSGPWLVLVVRVLFWMYCGAVLLVGIFQYYVLFHKEKLNVTDASPAWIFPIYPIIVVGPMAGTIIPDQPEWAAFDIWIGAVMLQGLAWIIALMMYAMYMQRLMTSSLPAPSTRPGLYVSVGPAGYTAAGLFSLGSQAQSVLPPDIFHTSPGLIAGDAVRIMGVMSGLFVILFAFWFFCISTISVVTGVRRMTFTLTWWAFIFPNAGLTLAAIQMGRELSSPAINGICSALTITLVILWFMTATFHIYAVASKKIMWPGKDEDKDMKDLRWGRYSGLISHELWQYSITNSNDEA